MDITEEKDIKKSGKNTQKHYTQKDLNDPDSHNGVIIHLESDITVSEVKWALGGITTNKASGGEGIPAELFQILKDDAVKFCTKYARKFGKLVSLATGLENVCFHSNPKEE